MPTELLNATPLSPLANMISPFMTATLFQLLVGNVVIGVLEAAVIARLLDVRWRSVVLRVIAANYFSTFAGGVVLTILAEAAGPLVLGPEPVFGVVRYLVVMFVAALVLSWLFEWLIVRRAFRGRGSFLATGVAQLASYVVLMFPLYFLLTDYSLAGMRRAAVAEVSSDAGALVYFLSRDARTLHRVRLDGSAPERVGDVGEHDPHQSDLWMYPSEHGADLWLTDGRPQTPSKDDRVLLKYIASDYPAWNGDDFKAVDLRTGGGEWEAFAMLGGYAPREGLTARNRRSGERVRVAVDTPFVSWNARAATILSGDRVVFQLGGQILLADLAGRRLAFVAHGHSPLVIPSHLVQEHPE
jgi:hypothetical protein